MAPDRRQRPVPQAQPSLSAQREWPDGALEQAVALQRRLSIGDRDWHALKHQRTRRAAEQISAALVHLLAADQPSPSPTGEARQEAIALLEHALAWLKGDLSDPGCPRHRR
jgi:hypothetical protein